MSGTRYKQREIVLVPFPYSDLSSSKRRPVLVVSNDAYNTKFQNILVCVITSNLNRDEYSVTLDSKNLEIGVLPESSLVKAHKLFTIHQDKVLKKFGIVNEALFDCVAAKIKQLIKTDK